MQRLAAYGGPVEGAPFGRYHLIELLGRGGMGEVWSAYDTATCRTVAIRKLSQELLADQTFMDRFLREVDPIARLNNPHITPIHSFGEIDGWPYIDMRLVDGTALRTAFSRYGPLTPIRAVAIIRQIASALDAAHSIGIPHRRVSNKNILITSDDFAYLMDFGVANAVWDADRLTGEQDPGSLAYMAPERFRNNEMTYRADVYALACVLHECLTGTQPYRVDTFAAAVTAHLVEPPPRPSVMRPGIPRSFDHVISRGMAKDPGDRYASAGDLALAARDALRQYDHPPSGYGDMPGALPAQAPVTAAPPGQSFTYQPLGGWDVSPVAADKFCCPCGDWEWYREEVGVPIPYCPVHLCQLQPAAALIKQPHSPRRWLRWLPSRKAPRA